MKYLKLFEDIDSFEFQEDWEETDKASKDNEYPGRDELFSRFPIGSRVRIKKWIDDSRNITGTVIRHNIENIGGSSVMDKGKRYNVFPQLIIRTDERTVIPDYRSMHDTYTNTIKVGSMDIDVYSEEYGDDWIVRV